MAIPLRLREKWARDNRIAALAILERPERYNVALIEWARDYLIAVGGDKKSCQINSVKQSLS